jgi:hypothetical protein
MMGMGAGKGRYVLGFNAGHMVLVTQTQGHHSSEHSCAEERGTRGAPANSEQTCGDGAGGDGVPVVLVLPVRAGHGRLDGAEHATVGAIDGGVARHVRPDGEDGAGETATAGRVAEALDEVQDGSEPCADKISFTHVFDQFFFLF